SSLSFTSSISTTQVRELCPLSPQRLHRLVTHTLFTGFSQSLRRLRSSTANNSDTSPIVRVLSVCIYRLLRELFPHA
ncbi:hypothetical protein M433DRAFT_161119, partial [Acidomyces richmondensis BFW]